MTKNELNLDELNKVAGGMIKSDLPASSDRDRPDLPDRPVSVPDSVYSAWSVPFLILRGIRPARGRPVGRPLLFETSFRHCERSEAIHAMPMIAALAR